MKKKETCEVIFDDLTGAFGSLSRGIDALVDETASKRSVAKGLFGFGTGMAKAALRASGCAIKYAPIAAVTIAQAKRELVGAVEEEYAAYQKRQQEERLREKIERIVRRPESPRKCIKSR